MLTKSSSNDSGLMLSLLWHREGPRLELPQQLRVMGTWVAPSRISTTACTILPVYHC